jgi:(S)-sulfolactate dehydrogenase
MLDIVVSEFMDEAALEGLRAEFQVHYDPTLADRPRELELLVGAARALIVRNRTQVRGSLLEAGRRLQVVGRLGVGLDNIDLAACRARGIEVHPATGANAVAVAEYVIAATLLLLRGAFAATDAMLEGQWPRERLVGREATGRRLGLLGLGSIAREVARRAAALSMAVGAYDPHLPVEDPAWQDVRRHAALRNLLAASDVLSLHVPLTAETRGLIDAEALALLPRGAVVVNTSRGGILDEAALVEGLRSGRLGGAALDVFATEPLDRGTALLFDAAPNLILTPHVAGVTIESNARVSAMTAENVRTALRRRRA